MKSVINELYGWYNHYTKAYSALDEQIKNAVELKYNHTMRVCKEIVTLGKNLTLNNQQQDIAYIAALFHDIARFEQFRKYRTFSDSNSENHALMGIKIINEQNVFSVFEKSITDNLLNAIKFHNAIVIPGSLPTEHALTCKLLRDADKIDIYKTTLELFDDDTLRRQNHLQKVLSSERIVTNEVCECILQKKIVTYDIINTMDDFRMIQLGWVYDLNYQYSLSCVIKRGYIDIIKKRLPDTALVNKTIYAVEAYVNTILENNSNNEK